jgi:CHAD domain-containing protein
MILLGYRCLQREFQSLVAHQPQHSTAPKTEGVHQMRIATRRLRVALRLFGHMLPRPQRRELKHELRWFARALGTVRDLDVHAENFRSYLRAATPEQAQQLGDYELQLRRDRTAARNELGALFASERYANLVAAFQTLLAGAPSAAALRRWQSFRISDGAAQYLKMSKKRVLKLGRKIGADAHAEDLHRLRIRAKRLRYEIEFFLEAYPELTAPAKATKALQDVLGAHQDSCMAAQRLAAYRRSLRRRQQPVEPRPALGQWKAHELQAGQDARLAFPLEWERFVRELKNAPLGVA